MQSASVLEMTAVGAGGMPRQSAATELAREQLREQGVRVRGIAADAAVDAAAPPGIPEDEWTGDAAHAFQVARGRWVVQLRGALDACEDLALAIDRSVAALGG
ncbi:hypothetical protein [Homoserinibacter sp. YIM 151385]|uniref:hypothetical protein n=1 Tax=Homoserinibacter sp. YIM 151385 TaxID=2985506 RepID=UPI0022F08D3E|nr:hypothetical protein [Homoserinibacter sp. YIM 151385]WBU37270.1 hypothetical protein OF852_10130 [Homoserinibacter sp. YIM 151385]